MSGDAVVLDGDRHESALTEKRGQFQEVCGCGWRSLWTTDEAAGTEHADHVAAEKLWGRLSEPQRRALDALVRAHWLGGSRSLIGGNRTADRCVSSRAAGSLIDRGYATTLPAHRPTSHVRFTVTGRGVKVHPLSRCSARHGGRVCGYCHACAARLPSRDALACPACGSTDYDE